MTNFLLNTSITTTSSTILNLSEELNQVLSSIDSYDINFEDFSNFASARKILSKNVSEVISKIKKTSTIIDNIIESHTKLQSSYNIDTYIEGLKLSNQRGVVSRSGNRIVSISNTSSNEIPTSEDQLTIFSNIILTTGIIPATFSSYYSSREVVDSNYYSNKGIILDVNNFTCIAPSNVKIGTKVQVTETGTDLDGKIFTVTKNDSKLQVESDGSYHFDVLVNNEDDLNKYQSKTGKVIVLNNEELEII